MTPARALDAQLHFAQILRKHGVTICFTGTMDVPERWEVIRRAIVGCRLSDTPFGKRAGSIETYRQTFERVTGQILEAAEAAA